MALEVKRKVMEEMMNGKEGEEVTWKDKCFRCDSWGVHVPLPKKETGVEQRIHIGRHINTKDLSPLYSVNTRHC